MLKQLRLQSILNKGPVGGLSNRTQKNIYFQTNIHKVIIAFAWPQPKQSCRCGGVAGAGQGRAGGGASTLVLVSTNLSTLTHATRHYYAVYPLNETSSTPRAFLYLCVKSKGKVLTGCNDCISTHDDIIYPKVVFFSELCPGRGLSCDHLSSVQIDISILYIAVDISILHTAVYKQLTYTLSLTLAFCSNIQI